MPDDLGIAETDYLNWKHHPVSKVFLQYLADYRESLLKMRMFEWERGATKIDKRRDYEFRGRTLQLLDLVDLPFKSITDFYAKDEKPDPRAEEPDAA